MSIFTELLRIAGFRENKAEMELSRTRSEVATAHEQEEQARRRVHEFAAFAERREREMYAELCTRLVRLRELEDVQFGVLELRDGERRREAELEAARKALQQATAALEAAREVHRLASRMKEKFVELAGSYDEERARELQRVEDMEMEEVHRVSLDREEREEWERAHEEEAAPARGVRR
ncbi:MAG TPA: YscO family type III secretion system apparatus protein [Usitatibacter sp.]|nr:YscO family type III secretion system apparatus protein [Usitatibacter sp.]